MNQQITSEHRLDSNGKPAGGTTAGVGITIEWQNGPLGRGAQRLEPNGAFVEGVIAAAKDRIEWYNRIGFECAENTEAIEHLERALAVLNSRTARREAAGIEGTHQK